MSILDNLFNNEPIVLPRYLVELGVIEGKSKERAEDKKSKVSLDMTNAKLMYIHENGSPINHIPPRPVLQMTIDWANQEIVPQTIEKCIDIIIDKFSVEDAKPEIEKELKRMCMRIQSHARHIIYDNDGSLPANSPTTIFGGWTRAKGHDGIKYKAYHVKGKGFNHPLFVTGQLARSITCRLLDERGKVL